MSDPKPPPRRSWKDTPTGKAAGRGRASWQRGLDTSDIRVRRRRRLFVASSLLVVLVAALVAVATWPKPVPKAGLILIGSAYEQDLALPANYLGLRGLGDLEKQLCEGTGDGIRAGGAAAAMWQKPVDVPTEADFDPQSWQVGTGNFLLLFVSLHGAADRPKQPFLFLGDGEGKKRFTVEHLLDNIDQSRELKDKHKLLLVDATQLTGSWPRGVLRNDFVAELKTLLEERRKANKDKNLWVLCASNEGQKSWPAEVYGRTAFAHFVIEGLRGAADGVLDPSGHGRTGRVTLKELEAYVKKNVADWVRDARNAVQEPVLLPESDVPDADLEVVKSPVDYENLPKPELLPAPDSATLDGLRAVWEDCKTLRGRTPAPWVYAPHVWRQYQDEALRYEQAVRAGDAKRAPGLLVKLSELKEAIGRETQLGIPDRMESFQSAGNSLPLGAAFGMPADDAHGKVQAALRELTEPNRRLGTDAELSPLRYTGRARPAEAHLALMLWRDRPTGKGAVPEAWGKAFKTAVDVRIRSEEAALSVDRAGARSDQHPYSEAVFPYVRDHVDEGDRSRRGGEDLLFATDVAEWTKGGELLNKAERRYEQASEIGVSVREALRVRDRAAADLPYYSQWLARRRLLTRKAADVESVGSAIKLSESTWAKLHALTELLDRQQRGTNADDRHPTASPDDLKLTAREVNTGLKTLEDYFRTAYRELMGDARIQNRLQEIEDALTVPLIPSDDRIVLVQGAGKIIEKLRAGEEKNVGEDKASDASEVGGVLSSAYREGSLGRSILGPARLGQVAGEALARDLDAKDFMAAGQSVGGTWQNAVDTARKAVRVSSETPDPVEAAKQVLASDEIVRTLDASGAALLSDGPVGPAKQLRRLRMHELLRWLAESTKVDHWYEEDSRAEPYYVSTANRYLADARLLARSSDRQLDPARQKAVGEDAKKTGVEDPQEDSLRPPLTDFESKIPVGWSVKPEPGVPPGTLVLWAEAAAPLRVTDASRRTPKLLVESGKVEAQSEFGYDAKGIKPDPGGVAITLRGLYRGQTVEKVVKIPIGPPPEVTVYGFPRRGSAFAVRAEAGALAGTLAIVLDGSPSMFFEKKPPFKYDKAVKALRTALTSLPKGTRIKIWRFGGAYDSAARRTEVTEFPTLEWRGPGVDPDVERQLNNLEKYDANGKGFSPIIDTMIRALEDLKNTDGIKTLLVLSDGEDNEPDNRSAAEIRKIIKEKFDGSGVSIHFVLYRPEDPGDSAKVRSQFQGIQDFDPPGRIYEKEKTDVNEDLQLTKQLRDAMTPKIWLSKNGKPLRGRGTDDEGFPITLPGAFTRWAGLDGQLPYGLLDVRAYRLRAQMRLSEGDRLLLKLGKDNSGLNLKRALLADTSKADGSHPRTNTADDWTASVLLNRHRDGGLQQLLALEEKPPDRTKVAPIEQAWPGFCWLDLAPGSAGGKALPVEWYLDYRYPAPTYAVNAPHWPDGTPSRLSAWWSDSKIPPPEVESDPARFRVTRGAPVRAQLKLPGGGTATVWAERQRNRSVKLDPTGEKRDADCLIITVQAADPLVVARPDIENFTGGEEHYYFPSLGYYQAVYWGIPGGDVTDFTLRLTSIKAFKQLGGKGGVREVHLNADAPDRDDASLIDWVDVKPNPGGLPAGRD